MAQTSTEKESRTHFVLSLSLCLLSLFITHLRKFNQSCCLCLFVYIDLNQ